MEVPALLLAIDRIVGRIEVEYDPRWHLVVGLQEQVDEQALDRTRIVIELVMPVASDLGRMLQPVQRRLAGQPPAQLAEHGRQSRVEAQRVVVDQVLVPERDAENALSQKIDESVLDAIGSTYSYCEPSHEGTAPPG